MARLNTLIGVAFALCATLTYVAAWTTYRPNMGKWQSVTKGLACNLSANNYGYGDGGQSYGFGIMVAYSAIQSFGKANCYQNKWACYFPWFGNEDQPLTCEVLIKEQPEVAPQLQWVTLADYKADPTKWIPMTSVVYDGGLKSTSVVPMTLSADDTNGSRNVGRYNFGENMAKVGWDWSEHTITDEQLLDSSKILVTTATYCDTAAAP